MAIYRLSPQAQKALRSIARYTHKQWGATQRRTYMAAIFARLDFLAQTPLRGRPRNDLIEGLYGYREGAHNIFYMIDEQDILILDILHKNMDVTARSESWT